MNVRGCFKNVVAPRYIGGQSSLLASPRKIEDFSGNPDTKATTRIWRWRASKIPKIEAKIKIKQPL
jgi:hypothetical protein